MGVRVSGGEVSAREGCHYSLFPHSGVRMGRPIKGVRAATRHQAWSPTPLIIVFFFLPFHSVSISVHNRDVSFLLVRDGVVSE